MAPRSTSGGRSDDGRRTVTGPVHELKDELVSHLREERDQLRGEWVRSMTAKGLLGELTPEETESESATIYDTCVDCLDAGDYGAAEAYAERMARRGVLQAMSPEQILGGMLTLRDVFGRSLFRRHLADPDRLARALDAYEPVANKILVIVAMAFIAERERVVRLQQEAIRELSTPVLPVRERLLILPIIGLIDTARARQLTEQLLRAIREHRAKVVVMDITGVPSIDSKVANHLIQTIDAARLLGTMVIVAGVSPAIAQTIVTLGVDLSRIESVGDLQSAIDLADRSLGYRVISSELTIPSAGLPASS